ncbi:MAG: hypothetical protein CME10_00405 [Gemmatimonadetes bacterium]|nr:hypothetical protein [Gemmatimonadota bacterium]
MSVFFINRKTLAIKIRILFLAAASISILSPSMPMQAVAEENNFTDEKVVHLLEEPRHRTVHQEGDLYLLDVQVNPGDTSFQHVHDQAILLTTIHTGSGPAYGPVRSIPEYAYEPLTHSVSNAGPGLLRIIALVNGGQGVTDKSDSPKGMRSDPNIENPWFRSYRLELAPGEQTDLQSHDNHTVVVQGSDGVVHVTREDGLTRELDSAGEWEWRQPGSTFMVKNMGNLPVIVAINEGRE